MGSRKTVTVKACIYDSAGASASDLMKKLFRQFVERNLDEEKEKRRIASDGVCETVN